MVVDATKGTKKEGKMVRRRTAENIRGWQMAERVVVRRIPWEAKGWTRKVIDVYGIGGLG